MEDSFGYWLAGFVDGEGCFKIDAHRAWFEPNFAIVMRADEQPILTEIRQQTGIGKLYSYPYNGRNGNPQASWSVFRRDECRVLVDLFSRFPLPDRHMHLAAYRDELKAVKGYK